MDVNFDSSFCSLSLHAQISESHVRIFLGGGTFQRAIQMPNRTAFGRCPITVLVFMNDKKLKMSLRIKRIYGRIFSAFS